MLFMIINFFAPFLIAVDNARPETTWIATPERENRNNKHIENIWKNFATYYEYDFYLRTAMFQPHALIE